MNQRDTRRVSTSGKVAVAMFAGVIVFALLFQWGGGVDTLPPRCFGMFGWYDVPCGGWPAVAAGAATTVVVGVWLWWRDRRT